MPGLFTISVVSHHHHERVQTLLAQLAKAPAGLFDKIIVTLNVPEKRPDWDDPCLQVICNDQPRGFGSNHNHAFSLCRSRYFCVINPDIDLTECFEAGKPGDGAAAPDGSYRVKTIFDTLANTLLAPDLPSQSVGLRSCHRCWRRSEYYSPLLEWAKSSAALLALRSRKGAFF